MFKLKSIIGAFILVVFMGGSVIVDAQGLGPYMISTIAFNPDGTLLALAGGPPICNDDPSDMDNFKIRILDVETREVLRSFGDYSCTVNAISWSPDGTQIASSSDEGTASVWNASTGEKVSTYGGSGKGVRSLYEANWNPVDNRIVVMGGGRDTVIWDAETGNSVSQVFDKGTLGANFNVWSPDGTKMAIGTLDEKIEIYDVNPSVQKPTLLLRFPSGPITALIWSNTSDEVAITSGQEVKIFAVGSGQLTQTLIGATATLRSVAWSGERIAAGGGDHKVRVWDVVTGQQTAVLDYSSTILSLDWSSDNEHLAYGGYPESSDNLIEISDLPLPIIIPSPTFITKEVN